MNDLFGCGTIKASWDKLDKNKTDPTDLVAHGRQLFRLLGEPKLPA